MLRGLLPLLLLWGLPLWGSDAAGTVSSALPGMHCVVRGARTPAPPTSNCLLLPAPALPFNHSHHPSLLLALPCLRRSARHGLPV